MEKKKIGFELLIFDDASELSQNEQKLLHEASMARQNAYAPYSKFRVGAAVLLENGEVIIGSNQENASYPAGLCAERVAIFHAGAKYPGVAVKTIAICASSSKDGTVSPAAPCGNCRQSIIEYEQKQRLPISLLLSSETGPIYKCNSMADILPLAFNSSFLGDS
ncbi:cytidine deaminase [Muricauda oceani]|uniref:Cytidine deaminase n=1 Tax=Flagellimonas oceani TaxID=2698672 RepID=A0A6G7J551_9FLAO|nr:cytidine deaminase [Allomuricauda oceani]MBW8243504.1 cytidine deaminase [Allomuricauda oceani]QII45718.1 cytidine deaminase [Allomuricauda oceani]